MMLVSGWVTCSPGPLTPSHPPAGHTRAGIAIPSQTPGGIKKVFFWFSHLREVTKRRQEVHRAQVQPAVTSELLLPAAWSLEASHICGA